jgi:hypothetical protein
MSNAAVELPLNYRRHTARVHVRPDEDGGWDVRTEVDGREIASDYCADWQRVERFRTRMQQWLRQAESAELRLAPRA